MTQFIFPAGDTQDVCLIQATTGALPLVINGNLSSNGVVNFLALNYARQLSFTSTANLAATNFTITGVQNGVIVTEMLAGPNNTTVYSTNCYDLITRITTSTAVSSVQVGTGYLGYFQLVSPNITTVNNLNYILALSSGIDSNQIGITVWGSLFNLTNNSQTFASIIANNVGTLESIQTLVNEDLYIYNSTQIWVQLLVQLTGTTSTIGNSMTLTFLQVT